MAKHKRILVVEDEEVLLDALVHKLNKEKYHVEVARNGLEGLQKMKVFKPDLILLDIIMPKMNGYEVLNEMHRDQNLKTIPVIIISNSGQPVEIDRALKFGVVDFLIKAQFSLHEVSEKVRQALNEKMNESEQTQTSKPIEVQKIKKFEQSSSVGKKILVVEDDQFLRELITRKLKQEGMRVFIATDGIEAMECITELIPDIILLDIIIPLKNGYEVLKEIKNHTDSEIKNIPVILLTNLGQDADVEKGKKLGANDYLIKASLTTNQVMSKIKEYIV